MAVVATRLGFLARRLMTIRAVVACSNSTAGNQPHYLLPEPCVYVVVVDADVIVVSSFSCWLLYGRSSCAFVVVDLDEDSWSVSILVHLAGRWGVAVKYNVLRSERFSRVQLSVRTD